MPVLLFKKEKDIARNLGEIEWLKETFDIDDFWSSLKFLVCLLIFMNCEHDFRSINRTYLSTGVD